MTNGRVMKTSLLVASDDHTLGNWVAQEVDRFQSLHARSDSFLWLRGTRSDSGKAKLWKNTTFQLKFQGDQRDVTYPGLSALNLTTTYPLFGTAIVSLSGGPLNWRWSKPRRSKSKACFSVIFLMVVSGDLPIPMTLKEYPCRWKGWLRFSCWTSSTRTTSTMAFRGISTLWVHMQLGPQSAGRLSPLQNWLWSMSSYWDKIGAGGETYEISSTRLIRWSPPGATVKWKWNVCHQHFLNSSCFYLTQKSVISLRSKKFLNAIKVKAKREKNLNIWPLLKQCFVNLLCVFQVRNTNAVDTFFVTNGVKWVQNLNWFEES